MPLEGRVGPGPMKGVTSQSVAVLIDNVQYHLLWVQAGFAYGCLG